MPFSLIATVLGLLFTYVISSSIVFTYVARFLQAERVDLPKYWVYTLGTGPLFIALLTWGVYEFFPHQPDGVYLGGVAGLFALAALGNVKAGKELLLVLGQETGRLFQDYWRKSSWPEKLITFSVWAYTLVLAFMATGTHVFGSDESQYALVSSLAYERGTLAFYPLRTYDVETGFFDLSDHPPAYYCFKIWHYLLQGTADFAGISKLIEPMALIAMAGALWFALRPWGRWAAAFGLLWLTLGSPGLMNGAKNHAIDLFRILPFFVSTLWLQEALTRPGDVRLLIVTGLMAGLSMITHAIGGFFTLPFLVALLLLFSRRTVFQRAGDAVWVVLAALPIGSLGYLRNFLQVGALTGAALPLFDALPALKYYQVRLMTMGVDSFGTKMLHCVLKQWTNTVYFGFAAWAAPVLLGRRKVQSAPLLWFSVACVVFFVGLMFLTSFFERQRFVIFAINPRYPLTVQVFLIVLAAVGTAWLAARLFAYFKGDEKVFLVLTPSPEQRCGFRRLKLGSPRNLAYGVLAIGTTVALVLNGLVVTKPFRHGGWAFLDNQPSLLAKSREHAFFGQALAYIQKHIPPTEPLMVQPDSMVAYQTRRYVVGDIYPKLLPFYQAKNLTEATRVLDQMDIRYLLMWTGFWPTLTNNTYWFPLISDPHHTRILYANQEVAVYELRRHPVKLQEQGHWRLQPDVAHYQRSRAEWLQETEALYLQPGLTYRVQGDVAGIGQFQVAAEHHGNQSLVVWSHTSVDTASRPFAAQFRLFPLDEHGKPIVGEAAKHPFPVVFGFSHRLGAKPFTIKNLSLTAFKDPSNP